ncbi:hypothetical protein STEG23_028276 [Scotinomys teguina]
MQSTGSAMPASSSFKHRIKEQEDYIRDWTAHREEIARILFKDKDRNWDDIENKLRAESEVPIVKTSSMAPTSSVVQAPTSSVVQAPTSSVVQAHTSSVVQAYTSSVVQAPTSSVVQASTSSVVL